MKPAEGVETPNCPHCGTPAKFYPTAHLFMKSGCDYGPLWACIPCDMWEWADKKTGAVKGPLLSGQQRHARRLAKQQARPARQS